MIKTAQEKLNSVFQKCEQNMSINEKNTKAKIINFPGVLTNKGK